LLAKTKEIQDHGQNQEYQGTLNERVSELIRENILNGHYSPGERLTETRLMEELKVGRTPIREALRQLEAEGLITVMPRKGATVNKLSLKDVEETYSIGGVLEAMAASLSTPLLNKDRVKKLISLNKELQKMQNENDLQNYCKINSEFHQILLENCQNRKLIKLVENLRKLIYRFRIISFAVPGRIQKSIEEHERILEAIQKGDPEAVRKAMEDHWKHKKEMLVKYLEELSLLYH